MKRKMLIATALTVFTGTVIYLIRRNNKQAAKKQAYKREKHLTHVFSHAKRYGGGAEFVL